MRLHVTLTLTLRSPHSPSEGRDPQQAMVSRAPHPNSLSPASLHCPESSAVS